MHWNVNNVPFIIIVLIKPHFSWNTVPGDVIIDELYGT